MSEKEIIWFWVFWCRDHKLPRWITYVKKPLSVSSLPLETILSCKASKLPLMSGQIDFTSALCVSVPPFFLDKETLPQKHRSGLTSQLPQHNTWQMDTHMVCATICSLSVCLIVSTLTAYVLVYTHTHTDTHTPPILSVLRNLLACQHWKTWKRSSARVHHASNVRLAARTIGEQSRYYFKTQPVNSGMHYLIYNHVNDSVHATYGSSVVTVSMDSVYDINRLRRLGTHTQRTRP